MSKLILSHGPHEQFRTILYRRLCVFDVYRRTGVLNLYPSRNFIRERSENQQPTITFEAAI